jgi:hypothetical protein
MLPSEFSTRSTGSRFATTTKDAVGGSFTGGGGSVTSSFLGVPLDHNWLSVPLSS